MKKLIKKNKNNLTQTAQHSPVSFLMMKVGHICYPAAY
jgi:hypothetical protein